jgi:hypothetical protein
VADRALRITRSARAAFAAGLAVGIYVGATLIIEFADGLLNLSDLADAARRSRGATR